MYLSRRKFLVELRSPCSFCGVEYNDSRDFELHHMDHDKTNNSESNLVWCCNSCHKKEHYKNKRVKMYEKGIPTFLSKIVSIKYIREEMVYDVEMNDPSHTFVSENGLVTCNSHSYAMAGDSLYGAYLKSHYPHYFYEVFLQLMEQDGDKDRLNRAKEEATRAYGINFPPYRFGQDNRTIVASIEENEINSSLTSIKGFSSSVGQNIFELSQKSYDNFVEFLIVAENEGMVSSRFLDLIRINYFENFGNNLKLEKFFDEFTKGKLRYCKTHTEKTKLKRSIDLLEFWNQLPNEKVPVYQQLGYENEILGYIQATYPISKKYVFVLELQEQFAPRAQTYCLANAHQASLKIQKKTYENNPFLGGDILYINNFKQKPSVSFVNGQYVESETEKTWWIDNYKIISPNEFDKIVSLPLTKQ
jgi:hypothetical protein